MVSAQGAGVRRRTGAGRVGGRPHRRRAPGGLDHGAPWMASLIRSDRLLRFRMAGCMAAALQATRAAPRMGRRPACPTWPFGVVSLPPDLGIAAVALRIRSGLLVLAILDYQVSG